jgi:serine/threonine-protein kinase
LLTAVVTSIMARNLIGPSPEPPRPVTRFHVSLPRGESLTQASSGVIAISPDGSQVVYVANGQLYLRSMDRDETIPLGGSQFASNPFFSDDGEWIGFFQNGRLQKLAVGGGSPTMLCDWGSPRGASWRENEIVFSQSTGIFRVPASGGGSPELLIPVDEGSGEEVRQPQLLPGGEAVLFTRKTADASWDQADIVVRVPETGDERVLVEGGTDARYVSSGHLLFVREGALLGARFDVKRLEIVGSPVSLVEDVVETFSGAGLYDVSSSGSLVYVTGASIAGGAGLVRVNREGRVSPLENTAEIAYHMVRFAPDAKRVAADDVREGALWVLDLERGTRVLVERGSDVALPVWNPDGPEITFRRSSENGIFGVHIKRADGTGEERLHFASDYNVIPSSWSRDGRFLAVTETHPETGRDIWLIPREGKPQPLVVTEANENAATFSPDGKWIAYRSDASGRAEIYMQSFPDPGPRVPVSTNGGTGPVWAPDGSELFYRQGTAVMAVPVETEPELAVGAPMQLFDGPYLVDGTGHASYDISPDGERFLMIAQGAANRLEVVLNWSEELKRLITTDN